MNFSTIRIFVIYVVAGIFSVSSLQTSAQTTIIANNASWKYLANGSNQGTTWRTATFNDASWPSGAAELGFGDSPSTSITTGKIGYYFRKIISLPNPSAYSGYTIKLRRDDGILVYINNTEVYRNNMPSGTISYNTKASSNCSDDGSTTYTINLPVSNFTTGNNVVAVEVHNSSTSSSDITFVLQLLGNPLPCNAPNITTAGIDSITHNSAKIFWTAIPNALSYNFRYRIKNSGASYSSPINTTTPVIRLTNLQLSKIYEFTLQTLCSGTTTSSTTASKSFTTLASPCTTPNTGSFTASNITLSTADISWPGIALATSYNVRYRQLNVGSYSSPISETSTSLFLSNLVPNTSYEFTVQAVCPNNLTSAVSTSKSFTTLAVSCPPPDVNSFATSNITNNSAAVSWNAVSEAVSYNVRYRTQNAGSYSSPLSSASNAHSFLGLQQGTTYEFTVQSVCTLNATSSISTSKTFTTLVPPPVETLLRGPYMTIATEDSVCIQWRTNINSDSKVRFGTSPSTLDDSVTDISAGTEHTVMLRDLLPNTKYFYSIGSSNSNLQGDANNFFLTAPENDDPSKVRFWVTGDFGNGSAVQATVRNSFSTYNAGQPVNGWLWLGDNAYPSGTQNEYQLKVFNIYEAQFKNISLFPSPGNHDYASSGYLSATALGTAFPYFSIFNVPASSGSKKYYSTDYGSIHFISLDSYGTQNNPSSAMYQWLQNDLAANTRQWTVVFFHHPPYTKGSHNSDSEIELVDMRNNIVPLIESFGVDLVLTGHSHNYERSNFIKGHFGVESSFNPSMVPTGHVVQSGGGPYYKTAKGDSGTVYVVCGVSGEVGASTTSGYPHNAMFKSQNGVSGSLILEADDDTLSCKFLTGSGTINDEFSIIKVNAPDGNRMANPNHILENQVSIFPNPTDDEINISIQNEETVDIDVTISDYSGRVIFENSFLKRINEDIKIDKSSSKLQPGIYLISLSGEFIRMSRRLVVY